MTASLPVVSWGAGGQQPVHHLPGHRVGHGGQLGGEHPGPREVLRGQTIGVPG